MLIDNIGVRKIQLMEMEDSGQWTTWHDAFFAFGCQFAFYWYVAIYI